MKYCARKVLRCIKAWQELCEEVNTSNGCICYEHESAKIKEKRKKLRELTSNLSKEEFRELRKRLCY